MDNKSMIASIQMKIAPFELLAYFNRQMCENVFISFKPLNNLENQSQ